MADHSHSPAHDSGQVPKPHTKEIWKTFWILAAITALEFAIAFMMPHSLLRVAIFVGLTIIKAFYIVAEFMHLKMEVKTLIWSIIIPLVFIVWLVIALLMEGNSILQSGT